MSALVELFGNPTTDQTGIGWKTVVSKQWCPYLDRKCLKVRKSQPDVSIGSCSVFYGRKKRPIIICPYRLLERRQIFTDCLHLLSLHEPGNELHIEDSHSRIGMPLFPPKRDRRMKNLPTEPNRTEIILYQTEDGRTTISVRLEHETVWLSQMAMAELFQTSKQNINLHLKNLFLEGEVDENRVVKEYLTSAADGKLDAFLKFNERDVLEDAGRVSMEVAQALALEEYEKFNQRRLAEEAERKALEDDAELEQMAKRIEEKLRKGTKRKKS
jgi:hypothetical protein